MDGKAKDKKKGFNSWHFLIVILGIYVLIYFIRKQTFYDSITFFQETLLRIMPVFAIVFVIMVLIDHLIHPRQLAKHMGKDSGLKGWLIAITTGIISSGPIYMWYPLLQDMRKKGLRTALVATFLYNRAIKLPLLPLLLLYFPLSYAVILLSVMIIASIVQGKIVEKVVDR